MLATSRHRHRLLADTATFFSARHAPCIGCAGMPYDSIADLPEGQTDQYSRHQKHAFLKAFNSALDEYKDESRAFAVAHAAAQRAPRNEPDENNDR
jgi:cation transport regulator